MRTVVVALALAVSGCVLAPKLEAPQLQVTDVQVVGGDLFSQRLKVRVHVDNPNDRALPVARIVYTLEVQGQELANGESDAAFTVPPKGSADFDMNVTTNLAGALLRVLGGPTPKALDYRMSGKVTLSEGLFRTIPFQQRGTFSLDR
ncbi:MAG TPA: LEA type 2 family protein [Steroidobacteraceae bacterium]|nr:LEA type 2 family protein [Steroidobacteraceae bacterium]